MFRPVNGFFTAMIPMTTSVRRNGWQGNEAVTMRETFQAAFKKPPTSRKKKAAGLSFDESAPLANGALKSAHQFLPRLDE
jgi:hypothetical protein